MKLTKKIISVFLVVLMAVSTMPMTAFASLDSLDSVDVMGDAASTALMETIEEYEAKMDGTLYTNMSAAYTAYVEANQAYDTYVYGEVSMDLSTYQANLEAATEAMQPWSYNGITSATGTWPVESTAVKTDEVYRNLLYCGSADTDYVNVTTNTAGEEKQMQLQVRFTPSTMLYDGITTPRMPVMALFTGKSGKNRYVYSCVLTDDDGNSLYLVDSAWKGLVEWGANWDYGGCRYDASAGKDRVGISSESSAYNVQVSQKKTLNNWSKPEGDTNVIEYNTVFADGVYYKEITPTFMMYAGSTSDFTNTDIIQGGASSQKIYVINYKAALDAIASNKSKLALLNGNFRQGGAATVLAGFDKITSLDTATYFNSTTNDYAGCANTIKAGVEGINAAVTEDSANYAKLRSAMAKTNATFNSTSSDKYTTSSWNAFSTAYVQAQALMSNLVTTGYAVKATDAGTKAETLLSTFDALEVNFTPADASALQTAIDDASYAISYSSLFTADSYSASALATNIPAAKVAIWGNEDSYGDAASLVDSSKQNIVDAWADTINDGIAKLVISKDAAVGSARDYSMNSIIEYAGTFTPADYSNYVDVTNAITAANNFDTAVVGPTTDTSKGTLVQDKVTEYEQAVRDILLAINSLKASFAKIPDGQVANSQSNKISLTLGADHDDGKYYTVSYEYPTETVVFRTTHKAGVFTLPDSKISFDESTSNNDSLGAGYLDSINIDSSITNETPEISVATDDKDHSMSNPGAYPGKLTNSITINNLNYIMQLGNNSSLEGSGIFGIKQSPGFSDYGYGIDLSGNIVTDSSFDFTGSLGSTNGTSSGSTGPKGSIAAYNGITAVSATTCMTIPGGTTTVRPKLVTANYDDNFSAVVKWGYKGTFNKYYGYATNGVAYNQVIRIVDISGLIDLINEFNEKEQGDYTNASWANFVECLKSASSDMDYANMTYEEIVKECQNRYDVLIQAEKDLVLSANNDSIEAALVQAAEIKSAVDAGTTKYSTESYSAFLTARQEAIDAINGIYSDTACSDLVKTEYQDAIDAIANKLLDAIANLVSMADFTQLIAAASTAIDSYVYSTDDLKALADLINGLPYLNLSAEEKGLTEATAQSAIDAETTQINSAVSSLASASIVDASALQAAKQKIDQAFEDPDAWDGLASVKEYIDSMTEQDNLYTPVTIYGATVYGVNATQSALDNVVTKALSETKPQKYTVTVIDVDGKETTSTHDYGELINIDSNGVLHNDGDSIDAEKVAWYYSYKSNTAENKEKYYTTSKNIKFVVKGNTTLRIVPATGNESYHKVTYVSSLNTSKVIAVDYVSAADGKVSALPTQPTMPYYTAKGYTLDGATFTTETAVTSDITVVANYEAITTAAPTYTITYTDSDLDFDVQENEYEYNDEITWSRDDALYWVQFNSEDDFNTWCNGEPADDGHALYTVVFYGESYTFRVHEDAFFTSLTQDDFNFDVSEGISTTDIIGVPSVKLDDELVYSSNKFSMISTFSLSDDYTFVESGLLVSLTKQGLKFADVDGSSVMRLKSSQRTAGNQYVISIASSKFTSGQSVNAIPYFIYADSTGEQHIVYGNEQHFTYSPNVSY